MKKTKLLLTVIALALIGFLVNKGLFLLLVPTSVEANFVYSLPLLYAFFGICTALIVWVLWMVSQKSLNNVGYTFLLLTSAKMGVAYFFLRPILADAAHKAPTEKINFFIIFLYFLAVETIVTIRILNTKR